MITRLVPVYTPESHPRKVPIHTEDKLQDNCSPFTNCVEGLHEELTPLVYMAQLGIELSPCSVSLFHVPNNGFVYETWSVRNQLDVVRVGAWNSLRAHCAIMQASAGCLISIGIPIMIMMTSSNGNIFHVTGPLCGEFTGPGEFPTQRPVTRSFDVFFDLRLNKRLSKQSWGWWFEPPSWSLWRHRNDDKTVMIGTHRNSYYKYKTVVAVLFYN